MIFKKSQGSPGRLALLEGCNKPNLIPIQTINIKYPIVGISKQGGKTPKLKVLQWKLSLQISCLVLFSCLVKEDIQTGNSNQSVQVEPGYSGKTVVCMLRVTMQESMKQSIL